MRARAWIPQVDGAGIWKLHRRLVPKGGNIVHDLKLAKDSGMASGATTLGDLGPRNCQVAEVFCFGMTMLETASNIIVPEEWELGIGYFPVVAGAVMSERMTDGSGRAYAAYRYAKDLNYLLLSRGRPKKKMEMLGARQ
ncbi:uncharacterized protein BT62DRAFT_1005543 [Guyanagaster necrorhizus]|uniref:Uncharacterized protein n=1 Tax=Guyanagaster necrorhizus TaxID=856835 RepID=A0A9P7VTF7_9AGAR|nr:uncharacterized protein BT62DRAFT_1005543 [Guyanagaster necrorhizus MCA 3950]KAG7446247.1 hypothetical protein BT62DRAFT_1005543 [Guyanagaster necrorhizus MCA 3950]